jgi:hypothetical protein
MNDNRSSDFTRFAGCGLALAAIIAAIALLIFALAFAGFIGGSSDGSTGWWGMMHRPGTMPMQGMPTTVTSEATAPSSPPQSTAPGGSMPAASTQSPGGAFTPDATGARTTSGSPTAARASTAAVGAGAALVIEDWRGFADDDALVDAYSFNTAVPDNNLALQLSSDGAPGVSTGVTAVYSITAPAPNDYVGFDRALGTAEDWSPYTHLAVQVEPGDRSATQLVLQWHEASGEVWRHRTQFADIPADGRLLIPLTADAWEWADWSDQRNQALDLDAVVHVGVYMGHNGPGAGTVKLGAIEVVKEP